MAWTYQVSVGGGEHWKPFAKDQLFKIFQQSRPERERRLLTLLITTGMRLDEAALLRWDDLKQEGGVSYFDLTREGMNIKNIGSM